MLEFNINDNQDAYAMKKHRSNQPSSRYQSSRGMTLLEILIPSTIFTLVAGGIFAIFDKSQHSFRSQGDLSQVVQQTRIAMDQIQIYMRQAGNDDQNVFEDQTPPFSHSHSGFSPIEYNAAGHIQINSDITGSVGSGLGATGDPDGNFTARGEKVIVRYDAAQDELNIDIGDGEQVLAENISNFAFTFYDLAGNQITNPASNESDIARIKIHVEAETENPDQETGKVQSFTLDSDVMLRSQSYNFYSGIAGSGDDDDDDDDDD